jgi:4-amino-4-deoxy-L-arabinose transferase-like glycosyltransferase
VRWLLVLLTALAFFLRVWQLDRVPPGWRDDELIDRLVVSQHILDGQWAFYYPDASGQEPLYHVLGAGMMALFGPGIPGIRLLSVFFGLLAVPLTYQVGRLLFGRGVGLIAAGGMAVSFWALMYSRLGGRHIGLVVFVLAGFYAFLGAMGAGAPAGQGGKKAARSFAWAGLCLALGFYTYFASRGAPIIPLVFVSYAWIFARPALRGRWSGLVLMAVVMAAAGLPLAITLTSRPELEGRVSELAAPLIQARAGDFSLLGEHVVRTLSMFHADGDSEWLYNLPFRPVFGPVFGAFFWLGVALAIALALRPAWRRLRRGGGQVRQRAFGFELSAAFLLIWWLVGIAPAFLSVPAASLSHTVMALPAVYLLLALALAGVCAAARRILADRLGRTGARSLGVAMVLLALAAVAARDLPDYFGEWPARGLTRFNYRADIRDVAGYLKAHPQLRDFAITGLLAGPWDRLALEVDLGQGQSARPRWYQPERALMLRLGGAAAIAFSGYPRLQVLHPEAYAPLPGEKAGEYQLARIASPEEPAGPPTCFVNGLCLLAATYDAAAGSLDLTWQVARPLDLPPMPLVSNPPPPGVYAGPRLHVFAQLLDSQGRFVTGDDGLWVDVVTLRPGDRFLQRHRLATPAGGLAATPVVGLYDPMTGARIPTEDGQDHLEIAG